MTKTTMDLSELLTKHDQGDFLRGIAEAVLQLIMEADVEGLIGAGRHDGLARKNWRAPTEEPGGVLWATGTDRRRSFGVKRCGWH